MSDSGQDVIIYPEEAEIAIIGGREVPIGKSPVTAASIMDKMKTVLKTHYEGEDPRKQGMTLMEAMLFDIATQAAEGDQGAFDKVMNRIMGKPLQQVANLNMNASLRDLLDEIAGTPHQGEPAIDVTPAADQTKEDPFAL